VPTMGIGMLVSSSRRLAIIGLSTTRKSGLGWPEWEKGNEDHEFGVSHTRKKLFGGQAGTW